MSKHTSTPWAAVAALATLGLTACGGPDNTTDNPQSNAPQVEITQRARAGNEASTSPAEEGSDQPAAAPSSTSSPTSQESTRTLGPENDEGLTSQPRHPSAAPTPSGFTWPEPEPETEHTPKDPQGSPRGMPDLEALDRSDPEAVSKAFVQALYSSDTRTDTTGHDAVTRAAELATPDYADTLTSGDGLGGTGEWMALVEADGWTTTKLERSYDTAESPDAPGRTQWFSWVVDTTHHGLEKDRRETTTVAYVRVTHAKDQWSVEHYELR